MNDSVQHQVYGNTYQFSKISAMQQFHVMRRLAAVSSGLGEGITRLQEAGGAKELLSSEGAGAMRVITPLLEAIGRMSNEDSEYVINTCLQAVRRQQGTAWAQVQASPGLLMFPDIGMTQMVALVWRVLEFNLGGFFSDLLSALPAAEAEAQK